jgi:hypothetical protein
LAGGEMRADIAQKAEKSRVTDVRVLRHSELAPENGTLALTRCCCSIGVVRLIDIVLQ